MAIYLCSLPVERGVDPGAENYAAMHAAALQSHSRVVQCLCQLPAARGAVPRAIHGVTERELEKAVDLGFLLGLLGSPP